MLNKNITPNLIAILIIAISFVLPEPLASVCRTVGLFALSGALTNWLAIHMLFERVPGLYGSGVIPLHFEEFKRGILTLVTKHLFNQEVVESTLGQHSINSAAERATDSEADVEATTETPSEAPTEGDAPFDIEPFIDGLDLDVAYDQLKGTIMESSFGAMLGMVGGAEALEPMRGPFKTRMKKFLRDTTRSESFQNAIRAQMNSMANSDDFRAKIALVVEKRLDQLTPEMVRDIVQEMIRRHLGWLVVWGAVFGGLIGLLTTVVL